MTIKLKIDLSEGTNGGGTEGDPSSVDDVLATIDFSDWHFYPQQDDDFNQALENVSARLQQKLSAMFCGMNRLR